MKKIIALTLALVGLVFTYPAQAQFFARPNTESAITNAAVFLVPVIFTTNLPSTIKRTIPLNGNGFSFSSVVGGTNSLLTTNITWRFEFTLDGTNWDTDHLLSVSQVPTGTSPGCHVTNIVDTTSKNYRAVRLYSIQNTNAVAGGSLFITNIVIGVR